MQSEQQLSSLRPPIELSEGYLPRRTIRLADNPHLARLKQRHLWKKIDVRIPIAAILPWLMLYSCGLLLTVGLGFVTGFHMWLAMAAVTVVLIIGVPFVVSSYAAILTANDVASGRYELMKLTPLSNRQLAWSYYYAVLWQFRAILWIWGIFMLTTVVGVVWVAALRGEQGDLLVLTSVLFAMMLQFGGTCWAMVALAVACGIRFPNATMLGLLMPLGTLLLLITSVGFLGSSYLARLGSDSLPMRMFLEMGILIVLPYGLLGAGLCLGQMWARE